MRARGALLAVALALGTVRAGTAAVPADSPDLKCGPIDCDVARDQPMTRFARMAADRTEPTNHLDRLRLQFWFTYPDPDAPSVAKPGHEQARDEFAQALFEKDMLSMQAALVKKVLNDSQTDASARRGLQMIFAYFDGLAGKGIDGGVRQSARPEFDAWVDATREALGPIRNTDTIWLANLNASLGHVNPVLQKAANLPGPKYQAYVMERDWAEFDDARRVPAAFQSRELYGLLLYFRRGALKLPEATALYEAMKKALTPAVVEDAAEQVRQYAQKHQTGLRNLLVTVPRPVKRGPGGSEIEDHSIPIPDNVLGTYADPLVAMEILATRDDDRRHLLYLIKGEYVREARNLLPVSEYWTFATEVARRFEAAFNPTALREAMRVIHIAKKNLTDAHVIDPAAIGSRRITPFTAFEDILVRKDPSGYLRLALAWKQKLDKRPEIDVAYAKLVAEHGEGPLLEAARRMGAEDTHFIWYSELDRILAMLNRPVDVTPVATMEYPEYARWKRFAPETTVKWAQRIWKSDTLGRLTRGPIEYTHAYKLQSLTPEEVKLWFTEVTYRNGQPRPARDTETGYPARIPVRTLDDPFAPVPRENIGLSPVPGPAAEETGDEIIEVGGTRIASRWRSKTYGFGDTDPSVKGGRLVVKVWSSDQVPTGLVRRTEDLTYPPGRYGPNGSRTIIEFSLESLGGFLPSTPVPSGPVSKTYLPPGVEADSPAAKGIPPGTRPAGTSPVLQHYQQVAARVQRLKIQLGSQIGGVSRLPPNARLAYDRLDSYVVAAGMAMQTSPTAAEQNLKLAEDALATIERALGGK